MDINNCPVIWGRIDINFANNSCIFSIIRVILVVLVLKVIDQKELKVQILISNLLNVRVKGSKISSHINFCNSRIPRYYSWNNKNSRASFFSTPVFTIKNSFNTVAYPGKCTFYNPSNCEIYFKTVENWKHEFRACIYPPIKLQSSSKSHTDRPVNNCGKSNARIPNIHSPIKFRIPFARRDAKKIARNPEKGIRTLRKRNTRVVISFLSRGKIPWKLDSLDNFPIAVFTQKLRGFEKKNGEKSEKRIRTLRKRVDDTWTRESLLRFSREEKFRGNSSRQTIFPVAVSSRRPRKLGKNGEKS